jgi:hypothetical protein
VLEILDEEPSRVGFWLNLDIKLITISKASFVEELSIGSSLSDRKLGVSTCTPEQSGQEVSACSPAFPTGGDGSCPQPEWL